MPLISLHFMSHIVALHLQDFITCFLGKSYVVSSLQAQGFHLLYIVAALTSMYRKSRKVALMAISEGSMYTFLHSVAEPSGPCFSACEQLFVKCACKHGEEIEETEQKLHWKFPEFSRTVSYCFFSPLSHFFSQLSQFRTVAYGLVFARAFIF